MKQSKNTLGLLGAALIGGMVMGGSAFAVEPLSHGYQLAAAKTDGEGKCGEGKCGADKAGKHAEGKTPKASVVKASVAAIKSRRQESR